jgi:hypothetical protein
MMDSEKSSISCFPRWETALSCPEPSILPCLDEAEKAARRLEIEEQMRQAGTSHQKLGFNAPTGLMKR